MAAPAPAQGNASLARSRSLCCLFRDVCATFRDVCATWARCCADTELAKLAAPPARGEESTEARQASVRRQQVGLGLDTTQPTAGLLHEL